MDVLYRLRGQQFVWDSAKAETNFGKHGIRFETACEVFFDPFACDVDASTEDEQRFAAVGETKTHKLLFVVHVIREDDWIRLISARPAEAAERKLYEDGD